MISAILPKAISCPKQMFIGISLRFRRVSQPEMQALKKYCYTYIFRSLDRDEGEVLLTPNNRKRYHVSIIYSDSLHKLTQFFLARRGSIVDRVGISHVCIHSVRVRKSYQGARRCVLIGYNLC